MSVADRLYGSPLRRGGDAGSPVETAGIACGEACVKAVLYLYFLMKGDADMMAMLFAQRAILGKADFGTCPSG